MFQSYRNLVKTPTALHNERTKLDICRIVMKVHLTSHSRIHNESELDRIISIILNYPNVHELSSKAFNAFNKEIQNIDFRILTTAYN
jgi:hypothetical protein